MISADLAKKIILESVALCGSEDVFLPKSLGKYLSQPIKAPIDLPSFDHSAMDGYAVRCGDTACASPDHPVSLQVIGTIAAGDSGEYALPPTTFASYRIMTGAPIPSGVDAVIPFEETGGDGLMPHPIQKGAHIRKAGEDVLCGEVVLDKGTKISSRTMALLAALGISRISVARTPRVVVVSTGNELTEPGTPLTKGKVHDSNGPALLAALAEIGIPTVSLVSSSDDEKNLLSVLKEALGADMVITIGGVSAGDFDRVPKVIKNLGAKILFHNVAIKPGKPFLFATFAGARQAFPLPIFGLPGNPVSALMVFDRFVRPALLKMMGASRFFRYRLLATAQEKLSGSAGKEDYLRVKVRFEENVPIVSLSGRQSAANLMGFSDANAVAILPVGRETVNPGEKVEVEFLGEGL